MINMLKLFLKILRKKINFFRSEKLGDEIGSNESSIYRYFENKHKLMLYLSSWYWSWMEYKLFFATNNIEDPFEKLKKAITIVTEKIEDDEETDESFFKPLSCVSSVQVCVIHWLRHSPSP